MDQQGPDPLFALLNRALDTYNESQLVTNKQLEVQTMQIENERARIEKEFETANKNIDARQEQFREYLAHDFKKFNRAFWALISFGAFYMSAVIVLMILADGYDRKVTIFAYATGIMISLLAGRGLASFFKSTTKPE